jgi:hypothetical protein
MEGSTAQFFPVEVSEIYSEGLWAISQEDTDTLFYHILVMVTCKTQSQLTSHGGSNFVFEESIYAEGAQIHVWHA